MHAAIDEALTGHYDDVSFATGIIARLATGSGQLEWSCAGHPRPLLLRGRKIVAELSRDPVLPFGLGDGPPNPRVQELEPDDAVPCCWCSGPQRRDILPDPRIRLSPASPHR